MLSNFADCDCDIKNVVKTSTDNGGLIIKDGLVFPIAMLMVTPVYVWDL